MLQQVIKTKLQANKKHKGTTNGRIAQMREWRSVKSSDIGEDSGGLLNTVEQPELSLGNGLDFKGLLNISKSLSNR
jgi:hypothetical protein